jgi:hypothetical protein
MIGTMTASPNDAQGTSLYSLDGVPGDSPIVAVRLRKADAARLAKVAKVANVPLSRVVRAAIGHGLGEVERDGLPDDGGQSMAQEHDAPAG